MENLDAALVRHLVDVAYFHTKRLGFRIDDSDDCAIEFAEKMLHARPQELESDAWLHRCARNYAIDYLRKRKRLQQYEYPWPNPLDRDRPFPTWEGTDSTAAVEQGLLHEEFWQRMLEAVAQLKPVARHIVLGYHLEDSPVPILASETSKTEANVRKILSRSYKYLREVLAGQGLPESEVRSYVTSFLRS